jgi:hypothetical protein
MSILLLPIDAHLRMAQFSYSEFMCDWIVRFPLVLKCPRQALISTFAISRIWGNRAVTFGFLGVDLFHSCYRLRTLIYVGGKDRNREISNIVFDLLVHSIALWSYGMSWDGLIGMLIGVACSRIYS